MFGPPSLCWDGRQRVQQETILRMAQEGHEIENHTWDHLNLTDLSDEDIQAQIQQTSDLILQISGKPTTALRPPYGALDDRVIADAGQPIILWSVNPQDWKDRDTETAKSTASTPPVRRQRCTARKGTTVVG